VYFKSGVTSYFLVASPVPVLHFAVFYALPPPRIILTTTLHSVLLEPYPSWYCYDSIAALIQQLISIVA